MMIKYQWIFILLLQVEEKLVEKMNAAIVEFYGQDPQKSADLARIVNKQHFGRVKKLMDESGGKVSAGAYFW